MTGVVFQRHPYLDFLVETGADVHMVAAAARTLRQLETSPSHPPTTRPGWDGDLSTPEDAR